MMIMGGELHTKVKRILSPPVMTRHSKLKRHMGSARHHCF